MERHPHIKLFAYSHMIVFKCGPINLAMSEVKDIDIQTLEAKIIAIFHAFAYKKILPIRW